MNGDKKSIQSALASPRVTEAENNSSYSDPQVQESDSINGRVSFPSRIIT